MQKVKVLKLDGRAGLRRPGTFYLEYPNRAANLAALGLVEIVVADSVIHEVSIFETKEEKHQPVKRRRKTKEE